MKHNPYGNKHLWKLYLLPLDSTMQLLARVHCVLTLRLPGDFWYLGRQVGQHAGGVCYK